MITARELEAGVRSANGVGRVRIRSEFAAEQLLTKGQRDLQYRQFRKAHDAEVGESRVDEARRCCGTKQDAEPLPVLKPGFRWCSYRRDYVRVHRSPYD